MPGQEKPQEGMSPEPWAVVGVGDGGQRALPGGGDTEPSPKGSTGISPGRCGEVLPVEGTWGQHGGGFQELKGLLGWLTEYLVRAGRGPGGHIKGGDFEPQEGLKPRKGLSRLKFSRVFCLLVKDLRPEARGSYRAGGRVRAGQDRWEKGQRGGPAEKGQGLRVGWRPVAAERGISTPPSLWVSRWGPGGWRGPA